MEKIRSRTYNLDGDSLTVYSHFDDQSGMWIEEYIAFSTEPRYTPKGRPWRSVTDTDCPYSDPVYRDCGTCPQLIKEHPADLIGICNHPRLRLTEPISSCKEADPLISGEYSAD